MAVISAGLKGCWVFGAHEGHTEVVAAAKALAASENRLSVTDTYDYGVSMDRSNAEMGVTLRSSGGALGRVNVTVATYGPADAGYFEVNVSAR
ncbi:hypothetical protein [Shimia ponticola]|uniref:hypothetical protein n=1 Tax=Shimia ponticola TaxID=2582893 RepID=UPI0011BE7F3D|nr:hypothetical protein [Shimia ponticola]